VAMQQDNDMKAELARNTLLTMCKNIFNLIVTVSIVINVCQKFCILLIRHIIAKIHHFKGPPHTLGGIIT
jgi:hypothetical protein